MQIVFLAYLEGGTLCWGRRGGRGWGTLRVGDVGAFVALFWLLLSLIQLRPLSYMTSCYVIICFYKRFKQKSNAYSPEIKIIWHCFRKVNIHGA